MSGHTARAHAKLKPSSSKRWMECPGSVKLSEGIPDTSSVFADEGTAAHELAEHCLNTGFDPDRFGGWWVDLDAASPGFMIVAKPIEKHRCFEIDDEMVRGVGIYVDWVRGIKKEYPDAEVEVEARVNVLESHGVEGTADCVAFSPSTGVLLVADLKYGRGLAVEPEDNPQALCYALGAIRRHHNRGLTKIGVTIIQPRAIHPKGPIRTWWADPVDLLDFEQDLGWAAEATRLPDPPLKAGEWCKFCKAAAICPARKNQVDEAAKNEFGELTSPDQMTGEQLAALLLEADQIAEWCKRVVDYAHHEAAHGRTPVGWKLVAKRATRKWKDPDAALANLSLVVDEALLLTEPELKTPAQVEKVMPGRNAAARAAFLEEFVKKESSGTVLAQENDPRPAVRADTSEFET
jgi:hypothetical protein